MIDYKQLAIDCNTIAEAIGDTAAGDRVTMRAEGTAAHERACRDAILKLLARAEKAENRLREFAEEVAYYAGLQTWTSDGHAAISAEESLMAMKAFEILGWEKFHLVPECECNYFGCTDWADGEISIDGNRIQLCVKHFQEYKEARESNTRFAKLLRKYREGNA